MVYCATHVIFAVTFKYDGDHPENVCPVRDGLGEGGVALLPWFTAWVFKTVPFQSWKVTVYVLIVYCAVTVRFDCTLVNPGDHPVRVYPVLVGLGEGAVALSPWYTGVWVLSVVPFQSWKVTVYEGKGE